ncbi:hypothetical protein BGZ89_002289, partial [Linnemannia elongata]
MLSVFQKQPKPDPNPVETAPPPPQPLMAESDSAAPTSTPPSTDVVLATATNEPVQEHDDNTPAPPEPIRWFHAVDSPLTKPNEPKRNPKVPAPPRKPATTWVPFSIRDSNALERAYALTQPIRDEKTQQPGQDGKRISEDLPPLTPQQHQHSRQDPPSRLQVPDANGQFQTSSIAATTTGAGGESILVNEDYLFEVNIHKMEIKP